MSAAKQQALFATLKISTKNALYSVYANARRIARGKNAVSGGIARKKREKFAKNGGIFSKNRGILRKNTRKSMKNLREPDGSRKYV